MASKANDKKTLNTWLRSLRKAGLVTSPPVAGDERTVVDGHLDIGEILDRKKLPQDTTPYVFWNSLGEYERGELVGEVYVYHGGDREQIRQIMAASLPPEFVLAGASHDDEAFLVRRRFDISDLDWSDAAAVGAIVERLERGGWANPDRTRLSVMPPHTSEELALLAEVLAQPELAGRVRARAFNLLVSSNALGNELFELAVADQLTIFKVDDEWQYEVTELVTELVLRDQPAAAERLALQVCEEVLAARPTGSTNDQDIALAELVLMACPTPATLAAAEAADLVLATVRIRPTITGEPLYPYAVQRLNQILVADKEADYPQFTFWLFYLTPAPDPVNQVITTNDLGRQSTLELLRAAEPRTPAWDYLVDIAQRKVASAQRNAQSIHTSDEEVAAGEQFALDVEQILANADPA